METAFVSIRVVNVDWYLSDESRVPILRVFGPTPAGQKACLHLHGALPYFMIRPIEGDRVVGVAAQFESPFALAGLLPELEGAMEAAMAVARTGSAPRRVHGTSSGSSLLNRVVAGLEVVRGVPFYGYSHEEQLFVKVMVNNPALVGKLASLLQAGHVLSTPFQPYESHIPFMLQVFVDYNISGMSYVHLKNAIFLHPLPQQTSSSAPGVSSNPLHQHQPQSRQPLAQLPQAKPPCIPNTATSLAITMKGYASGSGRIFLESTVPKSSVVSGKEGKGGGRCEAYPRVVSQPVGPQKGERERVNTKPPLNQVQRQRLGKEPREGVGGDLGVKEGREGRKEDEGEGKGGRQQQHGVGDAGAAEEGIEQGEDQPLHEVLAGISIAELFSQTAPPSKSPLTPGRNLPTKESVTHGTTTRRPPPPSGLPNQILPPYPGDPVAPTGPTGLHPPHLPLHPQPKGEQQQTYWWERQTTCELELVATVGDLLNPGLLEESRRKQPGGKVLAVASLGELWEEERARARASGANSSQLSAPPGLALDDGEEPWCPPPVLLPVEIRKACDDVAASIVA
ncbi:unnamed protein product, partial [Choristocarpus tenellus]